MSDSSLVADTHAVLWYLLGSPRLSEPARDRMKASVAGGHPIVLPSICMVEILYLVEKGRIPAKDWERLDAALGGADSPLLVAPLTEVVARTVARVPRSEVPDMPDRIIAATALHLGLPLVSRDRKITAAGIETVW